MAEIFYLPIPDEDELYQMNSDELIALLENLNMQIDKLNEEEPEDMMSEEYELWGDKHEKLEDLIEIISEILEQ
ncbi:MAG TPA: hypothetical protein H9746_08440 [Candidatus Butyricicoccus avistercoris]|uniref:Uncharacterized protein n=1 Tax=Candidatus Butyricicoccus avistercoris TaxID=2838518 RepID=A0A9D1TJB7_9FIRM|nr:hypothetical protein [Candidatus Butyricicoccus avistercoris]